MGSFVKKCGLQGGKKYNRTKFNRTPRTVCPGITGAVQTCPADALNVSTLSDGVGTGQSNIPDEYVSKYAIRKLSFVKNSAVAFEPG